MQNPVSHVGGYLALLLACLRPHLVYHMNPYLAVVLGAVALAISLALQFAMRRYVTWVYWLAVTMVADATHIVLGIPHAISSTVFAVLLAVVFFVWYATFRSTASGASSSIGRRSWPHSRLAPPQET